MSEPQLDQPVQKGSDFRTILFMVLLSLACALILALLASALAQPKEVAKDLDRIQQLLIAAKILDHEGHFLVADAQGNRVPAKFEEGGRLVPSGKPVKATSQQILQVYQTRIVAMLVDDQGQLHTFEQANINKNEYLARYRKTGYYKQPFKLIYKIVPNPTAEAKEGNEKAEAYVIPINGMGLWDAIFGYLAIKADGNTVIGISWYDQKETPGLGANMAEAAWQSQFPGKFIFQPSPDGTTDVKSAPLGLVVVKGKVSEVLGSSPKAKSAVDGMTGATLTGTGITDAYKNVLAAYRPFLVKLFQEYSKK